MSIWMPLSGNWPTVIGTVEAAAQKPLLMQPRVQVCAYCLHKGKLVGWHALSAPGSTSINLELHRFPPSREPQLWPIQENDVAEHCAAVRSAAHAIVLLGVGTMRFWITCRTPPALEWCFVQQTDLDDVKMPLVWRSPIKTVVVKTDDSRPSSPLPVRPGHRPEVASADYAAA
jgi:hypothetical protein